MRVLFVLSALAGGGAERCAVNVLNGLDARFERHLALFDVTGPYLSVVSAEIAIHNLHDEPVKLPNRPRTLRKWLRPALQIKQAVRRLAPDIVVSFLPEASLPTALACELLGEGRPKWIVVEQNATRRRVVETNPNRVRRVVQDRWIRRAYPRADHVIAVSQGVKDGLIGDYGVPAQRISVIYNPIDLETIRTAVAKTPTMPLPSAPRIVAAGRLTWQKGFDLLLHAFAQVRSHTAATLVILGTGELEKELKTVASDLGIANAVMWAGFQDNPWAYFANADLFVLSSRWEGFGNVIVEAMACGVPVVAIDCNYGPGEIITDGEDGLLLPVEDVAALTQAMARVLGDPVLAGRLRVAGLQRAEAFAIGRIVAQYTDVFMTGCQPVHMR